jgi:hypothetical protein
VTAKKDFWVLLDFCHVRLVRRASVSRPRLSVCRIGSLSRNARTTNRSVLQRFDVDVLSFTLHAKSRFLTPFGTFNIHFSLCIVQQSIYLYIAILLEFVVKLLITTGHGSAYVYTWHLVGLVGIALGSR